MKPKKNQTIELSESMEFKPVAQNIFHEAMHDASQAFFDLVGLEYDDAIVREFMTTSDGKHMIVGMARMLSFINERQIANLDRAAGNGVVLNPKRPRFESVSKPAPEAPRATQPLEILKAP
jgi:hypothetical protein